jgi:hypothetical protein
MIDLTVIDVHHEREVPGIHFTYCAMPSAEQAAMEFEKDFGIKVTTVYRNLRPSGRCSIYILMGGARWTRFKLSN